MSGHAHGYSGDALGMHPCGMVGCTGSRRIGAGHTSQSTFPSHHYTQYQASGRRSDGVVIYQPVRGDISGLGGMRAAAVGHSILLEQASRQRQSLGEETQGEPGVAVVYYCST